jgi:hypothetical protein
LKMYLMDIKELQNWTLLWAFRVFESSGESETTH